MDPDLANKTPNTKKRVKEELVKSSVKKLGPFSTFLTLIKGFVCTGILYLPKAFVNGGWLWTTFMLLIEAFITTYCGYLLLEVRAKTGLSNYSEIGEKTYGKAGRIAVDISLWFSQMGFCCAYVFFIKENLSDIFNQAFGWEVSPNSIAYVQWVVFSLLCFVRKIEKFAVTHVFADVMILITVITCVVFGAINLSEEGSRLKTVDTINPVTWSTAIGFAVYAYEGIGMILPV